jgi:hypothetical protein
MEEDNDAEDSDEEPNDPEYSVTLYCKEYPGDEDCICDDSDSTCVCNWMYEYNVSVRSKKFQEVLAAMVDEAGKLVNCHNCEKTHACYNGRFECTGCFVQKMVDAKLPIVGQCCICMDDMVVTAVYTIRECKHTMCKKCVRKIQYPRKCPLCRQDFVLNA